MGPPRSREYVRMSELSGHSRSVYTIAWNCSGKYLASGSTDKGIRVWDVKSERESATAELKGHTDAIHHLCWDPTNPHRLASTAADKSVRIWDSKASSISSCVSMSEEACNVSYSHDGNYIVASSKATISLIDTRKNRVVRRTVNPFEVNEIKFSKSGHLFVAAGHPAGHGTIEILNLVDENDTKSSPQFKNIEKITAHSGNCLCLDFDPRGRFLAVGSMDSLVSIWDLEELYCTQTIARSTDAVQMLSVSYDGQFLASSTGKETIDIADVVTGEQAQSIKLRTAVQHLTWSPNTLVLAYVGDKADSDRNRNRDGVIKMIRIKDP